MNYSRFFPPPVFLLADAVCRCHQNATEDRKEGERRGKMENFVESDGHVRGR
jgi:hypothetical protein